MFSCVEMIEFTEVDITWILTSLLNEPISYLLLEYILEELCLDFSFVTLEQNDPSCLGPVLQAHFWYNLIWTEIHSTFYYRYH